MSAASRVPEEVKQKVRDALQELVKEDGPLLDKNASERSISHKLAEHLQRQFLGWDVDCEYNRRGDRTKTLRVSYDRIRPDDLEAKTVFPDIIVHKRGEQKNKLVIEIKKSTSRESEHKDIQKLKAFTGSEYQYEYGLLLVLDVEDHDNRNLTWFIGGKRVRK